MMRLLIGLFALSGLLAIAAEPASFYVATNGNDRWSGRIASPLLDGTDGPLATVDAALKAARTIRSQTNAPEGLKILVRGGVYYLEKPIQFGPEDSGTPGHPLVVSAFPGEHPVLSGGRHVTGWHKSAEKPGVWEADIPKTGETGWAFHQLFVNGERRQRARIPNQGFFRIAGPSPKEEPARITFKPGDIKAEMARSGDVEVVALLEWTDFRLRIRSVDMENHVATLGGAAQLPNQESDARYYLENYSEGLDSPGEWYLDSTKGVLTYCAMIGESMESAEVIAPRLTELVRFEGDFASERPVQDVVLNGLSFYHADWVLGNEGFSDIQAAVGIAGALVMEGAVRCSVQDCALAHLGGYAVELGKGCKNICIVGNTLYDLGAGGVRVGETQVRQVPFEQNSGNEIANNEIHDGGLVYHGAAGVLVLQSGGNRVSHNHIHHLNHTAISVGWTWAYELSPCRENIVEFNHLHDIGQHMLTEASGVYILGVQPGTVIRNNLIHDVTAWRFGGFGISLDDGSGEILIENNVIHHCQDAGFYQYYGRDNVVRNNILALNKGAQLARNREEDHTSFVFTNNVLYADNEPFLGMKWSDDHFAMNGNVYFKTQSDDLRFGNATLSEWRQRGHDTNSIVADPLFVNPAQFNFALRESSPALRMGFNPIDLSSVGVRSQAFTNTTVPPPSAAATATNATEPLQK